MLRARMAERKKFAFTEEDIQVPAELLAGYEAKKKPRTNSLNASGKGKGKGSKGKSNKGKPADQGQEARNRRPSAAGVSERTNSRPPVA
jgi:hypothetical protein